MACSLTALSIASAFLSKSSVELPNFVVLKVVETDPGLKGDTAAGGLKKAIMDTGLQVNVPLFIKEGELLKIDTRTGDYSERVKG